MSEEIHPIARALLGDSDEPDREMSCCMCGARTTCPGFIITAVRTWNELKRASELPIRPSEMGIACPGECTANLHARKHAEVQQLNATTIAYLRMLFVGRYNPESLAWLRREGLGRYVTKVLNEEGARHAEG